MWSAGALLRLRKQSLHTPNVSAIRRRYNKHPCEGNLLHRLT